MGKQTTDTKATPLTEEQLIEKEANLKLMAQEVSEAPASFEFEGEKYQFSESAPQHILLNGKGVSQKEIAKDDELKLQLIGGNLSLIIKK